MEQKLERLSKSVDYLKNKGRIHKQQDIADALGIGKANLSRALKGDARYFTDGFLTRFADAFADLISKDWLLTGRGHMQAIGKNARPHIPFHLAAAAAGPIGAPIGSITPGECEVRPVMTPFPWYDFTITVRGDSMAPEILDGDVLACAWLHDPRNVKPGKIYVVDTKEGPAVKLIKIGKNSITCHSLNPDYPDYTVHTDIVLRIARVVGLVREL